MKHYSPCIWRSIALLTGTLFLPISARSAEPPEQMEKRVLLGPESALQWSAAESTMQTSKARVRTGESSLRWQITVDHFAGEPKYPIGWPRATTSLREPAQRDWSGWDYLEMWIFTDTSRAALPREPVGMAIQAPDKAGTWTRALNELKKGQWAQIRIPLTQIPRHQDVRSIQLHISESRYQHGDTLDFHINELALLRYARPTILEFSARESVLFSDAKTISAQFNLAGVKPDQALNVVLELRQRDKVLAGTTHKAARGPQAMNLELGGAKLEAGEYELSARADGAAGPVKTTLRIVESPWKGQ